jgi:excisionase family DNA binding protein
MEFDALWSPKELAQYLRVSRSWVYQRAESGQLPSIRIGGLLRFDPAAVRAMTKGEQRQAQVIALPVKSRSAK